MCVAGRGRGEGGGAERGGRWGGGGRERGREREREGDRPSIEGQIIWSAKTLVLRAGIQGPIMSFC